MVLLFRENDDLVYLDCSNSIQFSKGKSKSKNSSKNN